MVKTVMVIYLIWRRWWVVYEDNEGDSMLVGDDPWYLSTEVK